MKIMPNNLKKLDYTKIKCKIWKSKLKHWKVRQMRRRERYTYYKNSMNKCLLLMKRIKRSSFWIQWISTKIRYKPIKRNFKSTKTSKMNKVSWFTNFNYKTMKRKMGIKSKSNISNPKYSKFKLSMRELLQTSSRTPRYYKYNNNHMNNFH